MTRVLLVDDDRPFAERLTTRLTKLRCVVSWVTTAEDCFELASSDHPHLILLSDKLGRTSGLNVCNGLKRDRDLRHIPIIVMATRSLDDVAGHEKLPTHADAYVSKDDDLRGVLDEVRSVIARRTKRQALAGRAPPPSSRRAQDDEDGEDDEGLDVELDEDSSTEALGDTESEIIRLEAELEEQKVVWEASLKAAREAAEEQQRRADLLEAELETLARNLRDKSTPGDESARAHIEQLEKVHADELAETERNYQQEVKRLETELERVREQLTGAKTARDEMAAELEEVRAEKLDALERVEALEEERSRLLDKIDELKAK